VEYLIYMKSFLKFCSNKILTLSFNWYWCTLKSQPSKCCFQSLSFYNARNVRPKTCIP